MKDKKRLKILYQQAINLIKLYQYAILYNEYLDIKANNNVKEIPKTESIGRTLVLKKKFYGRDLVVG